MPTNPDPNVVLLARTEIDALSLREEWTPRGWNVVVGRAGLEKHRESGTVEVVVVDVDDASEFDEEDFETRRVGRDFPRNEILELYADVVVRRHLVGESPEIVQLRRDIVMWANESNAILIRGETGTGKEVVARALHSCSKRRDEPFKAVSLAAEAESIVQGKLFGHEKGAFTGADEQRVGVLESTGEGTLFLDEIGDITPATQVALLRAIESRKFERLGGIEDVPFRGRIVAATNRDLDRAVKEGEFRRDLVHRLAHVSLEIPPLRERSEDVLPLAEHFLAELNAARGEPETKPRIERFDATGKEALKAARWEGNARELRNRVEAALIRADWDLRTAIVARDLGLQMPSGNQRPDGTDVREPTPDDLPDITELLNDEGLVLECDDVRRGFAGVLPDDDGMAKRLIEIVVARFGEFLGSLGDRVLQFRIVGRRRPERMGSVHNLVRALDERLQREMPHRDRGGRE